MSYQNRDKICLQYLDFRSVMSDSSLSSRGREPSQIKTLDAAAFALLVAYAWVQVCPPFYGSPGAVVTGSLAVIAVLFSTVRRSPSPTSRVVTGFAGAMLAYFVLAGAAYFWPFHLLVPLAIAVALAWQTGGVVALHRFWSRGRCGRREGWQIAGVAVISAVGMIGWFEIVRPDITQLRSELPGLHPAVLLVTGIGFSTFNAILEECAWRGVLQTWLLGLFSPLPAILIQGASFGAAHWNGVPNGAAGALLATAYGIMIGAIAYRAGGLLAAIVAHVVADIVVFAIITGVI